MSKVDILSERGKRKKDWNELDAHHKNFILRVRNGCGGKYAAEPHTAEIGRVDVPLWELAEKSGFIESTGSYKFVVTAKFWALESDLFNVKRT